MTRLHCPACDTTLNATETHQPGTTCPVCSNAPLEPATTNTEPPTPTNTEYQARREALGLTQADVATYLGVYQVNLSRWEAGTATPRRDILTTTYDHLETTLDNITRTYTTNARQHHTPNNTHATIHPTNTTHHDQLGAEASHLKPKLTRTAAARARRQIELELGVPTRIAD